MIIFTSLPNSADNFLLFLIIYFINTPLHYILPFLLVIDSLNLCTFKDIYITNNLYKYVWKVI